MGPTDAGRGGTSSASGRRERGEEADEVALGHFDRTTYKLIVLRKDCRELQSQWLGEPQTNITIVLYCDVWTEYDEIVRISLDLLDC